MTRRRRRARRAPRRRHVARRRVGRARRRRRNPGGAMAYMGSPTPARAKRLKRYHRKAAAAAAMGAAVQKLGGRRRRRGSTVAKRRAGRKGMTKHQRRVAAGKKAARTRKRNKALRAARRKGGKRRGRRHTKSTTPKRRRRRSGRKARRSGRRKRVCKPRRGLRGRVRRRLSRVGRCAIPGRRKSRRRRATGKLRRSLSRAGRRARRKGISAGPGYKRAWRRHGRTARARLRSGYRSVLRGRKWSKKRNSWLKVRRNPSLGGLIQTLKDVATKYLLPIVAGVAGATALSMLVVGKLGPKLPGPAAKVFTFANGAAVTAGLLLASALVQAKVGGRLPKPATWALGALTLGLGIMTVARVLSMPQVAGAVAKLPFGMGVKANSLFSALSGFGLLDADGYPITREWGRYAPIQGYMQDYSPPVPGVGHYSATGLLEAPAGMGLLEAPAGFGRYESDPAAMTINGLSGLDGYVKVSQGLGDGSYHCPHCGAAGSAPSGAAAFRCWSCQQAVSGLGNGMDDAPEMSIVGPTRRPGGVFTESIFGTVPSAS